MCLKIHILGISSCLYFTSKGQAPVVTFEKLHLPFFFSSRTSHSNSHRGRLINKNPKDAKLCQVHMQPTSSLWRRAPETFRSKRILEVKWSGFMPITTLKDVRRTERSAKPSSAGVGVGPSPIDFLSEALSASRALQEKNYLYSFLCHFPSHFKYHLAFCLCFMSYRIFIEDENEFRIWSWSFLEVETPV